MRKIPYEVPTGEYLKGKEPKKRFGFSLCLNDEDSTL